MSDTVREIGLYKIRVQHILCERVHIVCRRSLRKTKHHNYGISQKWTLIRSRLNEQKYTRTPTNVCVWAGKWSGLVRCRVEYLCYAHERMSFKPQWHRRTHNIYMPHLCTCTHHLLTSNSVYLTINDTNFDLRFVTLHTQPTKTIMQSCKEKTWNDYLQNGIQNSFRSNRIFCIIKFVSLVKLQYLYAVDVIWHVFCLLCVVCVCGLAESKVFLWCQK